MVETMTTRANVDLDGLNRQLADLDAVGAVRLAAERFGDRLVLTTSFGAQSAVMLHLVTQVVPDIPVVWVDTGFNFPETYRFADQMTKQLGLNLKVYQSEMSPARMAALCGNLWEQGKEALDRYDRIRKIEPRDRAFKQLKVEAWLAGLRRDQTDFRRTLQTAELLDGICKFHPILDWTASDVHEYLKHHDLPSHPLVERGYRSIGDWHSTTVVTGDMKDRDGRFRGLKQECGLHLPQTSEENESRNSSGL